ncbi:MAG: Heat-inducible transcription repressor hrcA, partial [candidate division WS6 bacterium GW2011_GWC2_36_7]
MDITERQKAILMAIIKEFMGDAEEVGSLSLVEKYHLGVSSATIRNEMV